jgi:pyruvate,water dikinase
VLEEVARRGWYQYFDELGFDPMPRARVLQQVDGYPYLNLTISAQRDAEVAGLEPMTLLLDGEQFRLTPYEKPGFLASIKTGRNRKRIEATLARYRAELPAHTQKAEAWSTKTQELRWSQADVLQVMEEIERISATSFKIFFAARHNLEWSYNRLLWLTAERQPYPANLALISSSLCDMTALHEYKMAEQLLELGALAADNPTVVAWLQGGDFGGWKSALPYQMSEAVQLFLAHYGHRCANEAEIRQARWQDNPQVLFSSLKAYLQKRPKHPAHLPPTQSLQRLLESVDAGAQKEAQLLITQMRQLLLLQSQALHAFAHVFAGTRRWAVAAAGEAMADERLQAVDDVFFFELEEVKQMMTGEWNISARREIQATCEKRRATYAKWQTAHQPWLLVGDTPARPTGNHGQPGVTGQVTGPLRRWPMPEPASCNGAIVGTQQLNTGWSLILPFARALVTAAGTPLDPIVAAARAWHIPTVVGLGDQFDHLVEGAQTTVHGDSGVVEQ